MKIAKHHYNDDGTLFKNCPTCSNCPVESVKLCKQFSQLQTCKRAKALLNYQKRNKK